MKILDGKKLSRKILKRIKSQVKKNRLEIKLVVILVGNNSVSEIFVRQKEQACKEIGVDFELFKFPAKISGFKLKKEIKKIAENKNNKGVVIQLPLPKKFNVQEFLNLIPTKKDIDILSGKNLRDFCAGNLSILPPVVGAVYNLFKEYKIPVKGKNVVLMGAGRLVGFPLSIWLKRKKAKVLILNRSTKNPNFYTEKADILISGTGKPKLITGEMIKKGAVIIDAGSSLKKGKLVGDVDFKTVSKKAEYITPVPGGVGPLTVACLLENLIKFSR